MSLNHTSNEQSLLFMNISDVCRPVGSILKSPITEITLPGLQAEMTVEMTLESDRGGESPGAVCRVGTLVTFLRVGLVDVLVTLQVVLTLEFFITSHLFSLAVAPDMSVKNG